jgi:peroxin-5
MTKLIILSIESAGGPGGRGAEALPEAWVKDFEEEYGEMMSSSTQDGEGASAELDLKVTKDNQRTASQIAAITDPKFRQSELFKMMSALSNGEIAFQGDKVVPLPAETRDAMGRAGPAATRSEDWINDFEREVSRGEDLARPGGVWQREFESFAPQNADDELKDPWGREMDEFDRKFGAAWAESMRAGVPPLGEEEEALPNNIDALNFDEHVSTDYQFVENNSFLDDDGAFERGRELFNAGRLTESIEALEAAVKQKPEHSAAWQLLGAAQAENDRDDLASVALLKAIQADPDNRDALITLSVSYVNDFRKHRALECLQQWLSTSPHYQSIDTSVQLGQNFERNHEIITDMFIQAARMRPEDPDADVQIALGLLFNLTFDYERAIDCFKAAAMKRPDDYLVWNKLGATQANAKQSQEAIDAFVRALEIKPSYTRACSNLGISFMALNEYGEAAKAFLSALALNPNALHQWDNLRNVFSLMRRADLLKKCDTKDISLFAEEFNF